MELSGEELLAQSQVIEELPGAELKVSLERTTAAPLPRELQGTIELARPASRPKSSAMQSSPASSWPPSSAPRVQMPSMQVGSALAAATTSIRPADGVQCRWTGTAVRTVSPGRCGSWPSRVPTGPATDPVWIAETRIGMSSGIHAGWSASMRRRSPSGTRSQRAAAAAGSVQCGR